MGGIVFPNVANALLPLIQMDRQAEESRLSRERLQKHDEWMQQDRAEARGLQKQTSALQLDAAKRAQLKDAADATTQAALGVLNTPEGERPAAYQTALQFLKSRGHDIGNLPPQYTPGMDGMLRFYVQKAESVTEFLKRQADSPQPMGPGGAPSSGAPAGDVMARAGSAISGIESGGKYDATGPMTGGDRAYGKYQVMGANIPTWTQEALGRPMTPQEFVANPQAQDAVFKHKFGQYIQKFGSPEAASRAWFAGEGGMNNPDAKDVLGTSVADYAQKFSSGMGGPQVAQAGGFTPTNTPAQSIPGGLPQMPPGVAQGDNIPGAPAADDPTAALRTMQLPPGVRFVGKNNVPMIQGDRVLIQMPDNSRQWVPMPAKKEPGAGAGGPFGGTGFDAQAHNIVLQGMQSGRTDTPEYAAALAHIGAERVVPDPQSGQLVRIKPDISWATPSRFAGGAVPQPATPPVPGAKTVTVEPGKGKALDNSARDDLTKASGGVLELTELVKSLKPEYGGYVTGAAGDVANFIKQRLPDALGGGDPTGQAQWWQRYAQFANLERNKLFGSALTPGETANFNKAMVDPGMRPEQIKENLARQQEIASKALSRIANSMKEGGYNQQAIEAATGIRMGDLPDPIGGVTQGKPTPKGADRERLMFDAKKAIDQGAPRDAVIKRLREMGVEGEP